MHTRRTAPLLVALVGGSVVVGACSFPAEPASGQPTNLGVYSSEGFPPPGPPPVPGRITPAPAPPVAPANAPRPAVGPVATPRPQTSETTPRPTGAPAPAPGS